MSSFQFHKGTIKTIQNYLNQLIDHHFNSIKVQLRPANVSSLTSPKVFQFHKGTIKTTANVSNFTSPKVFQFHKGTIKTIFLVISHGKFPNFNSIKVQLRRFARRYYSFLLSISIP